MQSQNSSPERRIRREIEKKRGRRIKDKNQKGEKEDREKDSEYPSTSRLVKPN